MLYFSYGSNMSTARLKYRVPAVRVVTTGRLENHKLAFHKIGMDGSAKCDAMHTGKERDVVYGVVFEITEFDKLKLDKNEGLGNGYDQKTVSIVTRDEELLEALTYYATHLDPSLSPFEWYKEHVLRGAREHGLPQDYIGAIEAVEAVPDSNRERHLRELSVYG